MLGKSLRDTLLALVALAAALVFRACAYRIGVVDAGDPIPVEFPQEDATP